MDELINCSICNMDLGKEQSALRLSRNCIGEEALTE